MGSRKNVTYSKRPNHAARSAHARGERQFKNYDTSHIRPRKSKGPVIVGVVLAAIVLGGIVIGAGVFLKGCSGTTLAQGETVEVTIAEGSGAKAIGNQLQSVGVIASANDFVSYVNQTGLGGSLRPGVYKFTGGMTLESVVSLLQTGPNTVVTFTIPEGYTLTKTAKAVSEAYGGKISETDFLTCANNARAYVADYPFLAEAQTNTLEGFLFPKTYEVKSGSTADSVVRQMLTQYQKETAALDYSYAKSQGLTTYGVLILASIIEKEATADNMAKVASVFYNRLAIDMPLQSDATTAFVVGRDPVPDDLKVNGPYNTYLNKGLPVGPICSPGIAALKAACSPETTNYFYFYFKEEGGSLKYFFSETYEDHMAAIAS